MAAAFVILGWFGAVLFALAAFAMYSMGGRARSHHP